MNARYVNPVFIYPAVDPGERVVNKPVETVKNFGISGKLPGRHQFLTKAPLNIFLNIKGRSG